MTELLRFGVSMDAELLAAFDLLITRKGYSNRSEAIRDLVRDAIVNHRAPTRRNRRWRHCAWCTTTTPPS
jgi:metal-responsive CopG/Arc/MetJ family transcriptional regulator